MASAPSLLERPVRELHRANEDIKRIDHESNLLAQYMLSYDNHRRQLTTLVYAHVPLVLFIFVFAAIGGHNHVAESMVVYAVLFGAFVVGLLAFGIGTTTMWWTRFFGILLFMLSAAMFVVVLYAVRTELDMNAWHDWTLVALQVVDMIICVMYFYTSDQIAGAGGEISAIVAHLHHEGHVTNPCFSREHSTLASNNDQVRGTWWQRFCVFMHAMGTASPRRPIVRVHTD